MNPGRRTINIELYDGKFGEPFNFAAYEEDKSLINPIAEAYAVGIDGHYVLRTKSNGEETSDIGVVDLGNLNEVNRRLVGMLSRCLPRGDVTYRFHDARVLDVLASK